MTKVLSTFILSSMSQQKVAEQDEERIINGHQEA